MFRSTIGCQCPLARPQKRSTHSPTCGIKRFVEDYRCHLDSEAGILDYMTSCHEQQLRAAFREMLREGFAPKKPLDVAVVPFLLITTNYSDTILQSLVNVLVEICEWQLDKGKRFQTSS